MKIGKTIILLIFVSIVFTTAAYAAEANFSASLLTANDVNCKKCHTDTPHVIHAKKPVECVNCHGDKLTVAIPKCTKCHDGPIHQVHAGKVSTQTCEYCHKTIAGVHNNLISDAVCSHCHKDLIDVHGKEAACIKCHKSPPGIVKPVKSEGMVLICQDCHANSSVATIHGEVDDKKGCYLCHGGTSKAAGSEIPHVIHATKVDCKGCHQENGQVVVPKCTRCHDVDKLHAFEKIGKLTAQSGLKCAACHADETKLSAPQTAPVQVENTSVSPVQTSNQTTKIENTSQGQAPKIPGFEAISAIGLMMAGYMIRRWG
jgi:Class III cytochrome C family